jgi:carbonic anhydrase
LLNFQNTPDNFAGGKISHFLDRWQKLTSDPWILDIKGYKIEFEALPRQRSQPKQLVFNAEENNFVQQEVQKVLEKGIVRPALVTKNQYISNFSYDLNVMAHIGLF